MRLFLFSLHGEWFALRREQVRGVLPRDGATPGTARLGLPGSVSSDPAAHFLVVAGPDGRDALMEAERVPGLVELREDALHEVPSFVFPDAAVTVSGIFEWDGGLAALLEPAGLDLRPVPPLA